MKYIGSKNRIARDILAVMLGDAKSGAWVEPFSGGCNVIDKVPTTFRRVANDSNVYVQEMFKALLSGWRPKSHYTRTEYDAFRRLEGDPWEIGYVGVNCSYSGKWFGGYAGLTATKGGERDYQAEAWRNVSSQLPNLIGVEFVSSNYVDLVIPDGSIVYCDPPYQSTTGYGRYSVENYSTFWEWVRTLSLTNAVFVSEYTGPDDFACVWSAAVSSSLSANGKHGQSKHSVEKLFVRQDMPLSARHEA